MTRILGIREEILEQYAIGCRVSEAEGLWRMRTSILNFVVGSGDLGVESSLIASTALAEISKAPLPASVEESFSDAFFTFRERKHGSALVCQDAEDFAVLACLGAFACCNTPDETPSEIAAWVEEALTGKIGRMSLA